MFIQLTGGAYQSRTLIAAAQRCLNLYLEPTPGEEGEPIRVAHLCTPGLTLQAGAPDIGCRGLYTASTGDLYACYGQHLLHYSSDGTWTDLGHFRPSSPTDATQRDNPVSMADNGFVLILVDGSLDGYFDDLTQPVASQTLTTIDRSINTGWLGADAISYQDTFFLMNSPGTTDWYISLSNIVASNLTAAYNVFTATVVSAGSGYAVNDVLTPNNTGGAQITVNSVNNSGVITGYGVTGGGSLNSQPSNPVAVTGGNGTGATFNLTYQTNIGGFDPLDFVSMEAQVTNCVAAVSVHRNVWLLGTNSYEIWVNSGGDGTFQGSFPFQLYPTGFGNWGCTAKYSIASEMNRLFWVSQDKYGHGIIFMGEALSAKRISTFAIEFEIAQYSTITDAIGYCYQQMGHVFYVVTFPAAHNFRGATWVYDATTNEWHERCYIDENGLEYRHLSNAAAGAYGLVFTGDWRNGNLYTFDLDNYTDNGSPIKRVRSFPHQIDLEANRRVMYHQLVAQMQVGAPSEAIATQSFLDCTFAAADNTLLQNYHNINSFGAKFTKIDTVDAVIISDAVIGQEVGDVLYSVAGAPNTANYTVRYKVQPTDYAHVASTGTVINIIGRANSANLGYEASVYSDGTQYYASLTVGNGSPMWLPLGAISSGDYELYLSMKSTAINLSVFRSQDGHWLNSAGVWVGSTATAVAIVDSTYTQPGTILLGGNWGGAGDSVSIDPVTAATAQIGSLTVDISNMIILNLSGLMITSFAGLPVAGLSQQITIAGVETDSRLGALSVIEANFITIGVAGVVAASTPGTIAVSIPQSIALVGIASIIQLGTPGVTESTSITIGISGVVSTSAPGTIAVSIPQSLTLTGVASSTTVGTPGAQVNNTVSIGLNGVASPVGIGTVAATGLRSITLSGVASTGAIGTPTLTKVQNFTLTGVQTISHPGTPTVAFARNVNVTPIGAVVTSGIGTIATSAAPAQAHAAGYDSLVFFDDFTSNTIATTQPASSGFNWYWNFTQTNSNSWNVATTTKASQISNGNTGGGFNASPAGGILQINTGQFPNNGNIISIPGYALNRSGAVLPPLGTGHWKHFYVEAYLQFKINGNLSTNQSNGWPAFWGWTAESLGTYGFGSSSLLAANPTEVDFFESFGTIFGNTPGHWGSTLYNHGTTYVNGFANGTTDNNWHTYGMLWTPGQIKIYYDNVLVGTTTTTSTAIESNQSLFLILGTGNTWQFNVDWVKVWQAPPVPDTRPQAVKDAGFNTVVFFDDFTNANTITNTSTTSGFNWYHNTANNQWSVQPNTLASQISNGNTGGGSSASSNGGIWVQNGSSTVGTYNGNWQTCPSGNAAVNGVNGKPNYWKHAYFEAYMQWNALAPGYSGGNWFPAFWSWSVNPSNPAVEVDFIENYYTPLPNHTNWGISDPGGDGMGSVITSFSESVWDSQWHLIGCLWQSTGTGTGSLTFYIDGVQQGSTVPTGPATRVIDMENIVGLFMTIGTGTNWTTYTDWVRVWQAP